jgi:hypothetical protein
MNAKICTCALMLPLLLPGTSTAAPLSQPAGLTSAASESRVEPAHTGKSYHCHGRGRAVVCHGPRRRGRTPGQVIYY